MNKKIQKGQNTAAIPEVLGAKPGYCTGSLHTGPPKGWAHRHLSYPCGSACQSAPLHSPHMRNSLLTPLLSPASKQGHVLLVFAPSWCSHKKALPEFLLWPLTSLCGLESKGPVQSSSLIQWFETAPSRTCPQCRIQVGKRTIINKLYFDLAQEEENVLDAEFLKNELDNTRALLSQKEKEKRDSQLIIDSLRDTLDERNATVESLQRALDKAEMLCSALKVGPQPPWAQVGGEIQSSSWAPHCGLVFCVCLG
uniref:TRAF interacting protein n=1 Tax=Capra hircus TaxID=9925 RepID=A0A8C2SI78_CAPHI